MGHTALFILWVLSSVTAAPAVAQTAASLYEAAGTITSEDVARHIGVIADDSMLGRDTPSPGLEKTAQYIADQFQKFGLKPGGDDGTWLQRYPVPNGTGTAPNTVGIIEGSDPKLKNEYVVFVAHMDHLGVGGGGTDSIYNGADDNASGTAGIIELAEAFSRPGARPRRSLVFLAVSGEEKPFWGSQYFVEHPPMPIAHVAANITLDMIGRNWEDTVLVVGKVESDLGETLDRVAAARPELRMVPVEMQWVPGSDHVPFAAKGIPVLAFFTDWHADYHQVSDSPEKIGTEKEAQLLRLVFHVGQEVANADRRPRWDEASYEKVTGQPYPTTAP